MKKAAAVLTTVLVLASCASVRAKKPFTVDIYSPRYAAGSAEAQVDKPLGGLRKTDVKVYYYPDDDAVCLEFRADTVTYSQFWSREGRDAFTAALERYKADFEGRNLAAKSSKTKRVYGEVQGYLAWGVLLILTQPARGVVRVELGYTFKDRSPFFSVFQRSAEYKDEESRKTTSANVLVYFTRAQAEAVAGLFNQEYLDGLERGTQPDGMREKLRNFFNVR
jgi:hypothetical protein